MVLAGRSHHLCRRTRRIPSQSHPSSSSARAGATRSGEQELRLSLVLPSFIFLDLLVAKTPGRVYGDAAGSPTRLFCAVGLLSPATSLLFVLAQARRWAAFGIFSTFSSLFFSLLGVFPSLPEQGFSFLMGISNWPRLCGKDAVKRCPV